MIKVITKDYETVCENCNAKLKFEQEDVYYGNMGCAMITCPVCGKETDTYLEGLSINENNVEFPLHFYHFGKDAVDINNKEINKWVKEVLKRLKQSTYEYDFSEVGTGNTHVIGLKYMDGSINIKVMKNYWDLNINKEE